MTIDIALLLGTIVVALVLFSIEKIPADVIALAVLVFLVLAGLLPAERAVEGFGSDVFVTIMGLLVLSETLSRTGVTDYVGMRIVRWTNSGESQLILLIMGAALVLGAFMSNTAATAFFIPIVIGLARRAEKSPAKFLMPLAFASILASSITLISTSTNIVVSGFMSDYDMSPLGMFELSPVGVPIALVGFGYLFFLGRHLVPDRFRPEEYQELSSRLYLTELLVLPESSLVGETLKSSNLGQDLNLNVLRIIRDSRRYILPKASTDLEAGDVLLVEGSRSNVLQVKEMAGVEIKADYELANPETSDEDIDLTEVILMPGSPLIGRTLKGLRFRQNYGLQVLAINRHGETLRRKLSQIRLQTGDSLIVQGDRAQIETLESQDIFRAVDTIERAGPRRKRAWIAVTIFASVLVIATLELISLPVAMLMGMVAAFLTRCITPAEAYSRVSWNALILIASMLGLGVAMEVTGTAEFLAVQIVELIGRSNPVWLLSAFFGLTVLLTQPMSNQAAAAVVLPVAVETANQLGLNPRSFAIMIALAASCSFLTPLEPACLLVYGPGRYRFWDFVKVGALPTVLIYLISIAMVPWLWPVH